MHSGNRSHADHSTMSSVEQSRCQSTEQIHVQQIEQIHVQHIERVIVLHIDFRLKRVHILHLHGALCQICNNL